MRIWQHRLNRVFGWSATGAAALYLGLILTGVMARLLGFGLAGVLTGPGTLAFLLMILAALAWAITWAAGWGNAPAGRFGVARDRAAGLGAVLLWGGAGAGGCLVALLIVSRILWSPAPSVEDDAVAAGLAGLAAIVGILALRVALPLKRAPERAGRNARSAARLLTILAVGIAALGPLFAVVWTVATALALGEDWGWMVLIAPVTIATPVAVGEAVALAIWLIAFAFARAGRKR